MSEKLPILRQSLLRTMLLGWSSSGTQVTSLLRDPSTEGGMLTVPIPQALQCQLALLLRCSSVGVGPAGTDLAVLLFLIPFGVKVGRVRRGGLRSSRLTLQTQELNPTNRESKNRII